MDNIHNDPLNKHSLRALENRGKHKKLRERREKQAELVERFDGYHDLIANVVKESGAGKAVAGRTAQAKTKSALSGLGGGGSPRSPTSPKVDT